MDKHEKDKKVLEFWDGGQNIAPALFEHAPKKPFKKEVNVTVAITYKKSQKGEYKKAWINMKAQTTGYFMALHGYIKREQQINEIRVSRRYGDIPGIAFCMTEAEEGKQ